MKKLHHLQNRAAFASSFGLPPAAAHASRLAIREALRHSDHMKENQPRGTLARPRDFSGQKPEGKACKLTRCAGNDQGRSAAQAEGAENFRYTSGTLRALPAAKIQHRQKASNTLKIKIFPWAIRPGKKATIPARVFRASSSLFHVLHTREFPYSG